MPKASKETAPQVEAVPGQFEGRYAELEGTTVGWERYDADFDGTPLFVGLPDDRCQARHWGVVLKGRVMYRYADHEDVIEAGEAYMATPGHVPLVEAGSELIEFSPSDELAATMEVVLRNVAKADASAG